MVNFEILVKLQKQANTQAERFQVCVFYKRILLLNYIL